MQVDADAEIEAMGVVSRALSGLDGPARGRVIRWVSERYELAPVGVIEPTNADRSSREAPGAGSGDPVDPEVNDDSAGAAWEHFAELYEAAGASTHPEGMLVAAYWVQVVNGNGSFGSFELNKLLKDLGHGVTGTAKVMSALIARKPALILQLKKSGKSQQARKTYRLTDAGRKTVEQMVANAG